MSDLYIQIADGSPINHPAYAANVYSALGGIPADWVPFTRIPKPHEAFLPVGVYQVSEVSYIPDGEGWKDSWSVRDMTPDEKEEKIAQVQSYQPYPSWVWDEPTCAYQPPSAQPEGAYWRWDESSQAWIDVTPPDMKLSSVSFL